MRNYLFIVFILIAFTASSQKDHFASSEKNGFSGPSYKSYELGVFAGISYYIGELNPGGHFKFIHPAGGLVFRYNLNNRYSYKFSAIYGRISGDNPSVSTLQQGQALNFVSPIIEAAVQVEFNFLSYNAADENPYFTPYVFAGLSAFYFNPSSGGNKLQPLSTEGVKYTRVQPAFPFGAGMKFKFSHRFLLSAEWGLRKTTTDYIDDISTVYTETGLQRGNSKTKDWYSFAGVILSFRVGEKPSVCNNFSRK